MSLSYNPSLDTFNLLVPGDDQRAVAAGLTLSTKATGPRGEKVFYPADYDKKPIFNPYAVLDFYDEADGAARAKLSSYMRDYKNSWAQTYEGDFPHPETSIETGEPLEYMQFQKAGIAFGLQKGNILIGDEPGLGKTVEAIGICNAKSSKRNLIICPASIRLQWYKKIREWSSIENVLPYPVMKAASGVSDVAHYVIVSYDLTRHAGIHDALCALKWDNIVVDEAHYLKSTDARRTQAIFGASGPPSPYFVKNLLKRCGNVIALTGTPLPNRPRECYTLARAICFESIDYMSFDEFCYRFNPSAREIDGDKVFTMEKKGRLPELQARLRTNFMIRRMKEDVQKELPKKRYELTYVESNGKIKEVLAKERMLHFKIEELKDPFAEIWGMISTIRREMGEAKVPRVIEHVKYLLDLVEIPKLCIFAHHKSVMNTLAQELGHYGLVQIRGGVSPLSRQSNIDQFRKDEFTRIFLGQMDASGFGVDGLQDVCDWAVFAEPSWTPGINEQVVDRLHRIGQKKNVLAQFLVVEGSLDERILAANFEKVHTIHESLDRRL